MIQVHGALLAAHIPQLADVVVASCGPGVRAAGTDCCRPDIVRVAMQSEVLLADCYIPPTHLQTQLDLCMDELLSLSGYVRARTECMKPSLHTGTTCPCFNTSAI